MCICSNGYRFVTVEREAKGERRRGVDKMPKRWT